MAESGSWIGDQYRIIKRLGKGGTSSVYLAEDRQLHLRWAIKEIPAYGTFVKKSTGVWNEIQILKRLHHPQIPRIVGVISQDHCFYVVMDYIEGESLDQIRRKTEKMRVSQIIDWALQLCEIFDYLHSRKPLIIYQDVKPENILQKADGTLMLVDFGISGYCRSGHENSQVKMGTPGFAAPEQYAGGEIGRQTDVYGLGMTLYWLWKGRFPGEKRGKRASGHERDLRLDRILRRCTGKKVKCRYQNMRKLKNRFLWLQKKKKKERLPGVCVRLALFAGAFISSVFAASGHIEAGSQVTGLRGGVLLAEQQRERCEEFLHRMEKYPDDIQKEQMLLSFLKEHPYWEKGYEILFSVWKQDGRLDETERTRLEQLMYDVKMQISDSAIYGRVLYQVGRIYWYYYEQEDLRMPAAITWFEEAADVLLNGKEKKLAKVYVRVGAFYRNLPGLVAEGREKGVYMELWNDLGQMREMLQEEWDTEHVIDAAQMKLEFGRIAVTAAESYGQHWMAEGVSEQEVLELLLWVRQECEAVEPSGQNGEIIKEYVLERALKTEQMIEGGSYET